MTARLLAALLTLACFAQADQFDLVLEDGWNFISLPLEPDDGSIATLFADSVDAAWGWDRGHFVRAQALEGGRAYWLHCPVSDARNPVTITVHGTTISERSLPLHRGWNAIAPRPEYNQPADPGIVGGMYWWNAQAREHRKAGPTLTAGQGYWVHALHSTTAHFGKASIHGSVSGAEIEDVLITLNGPAYRQTVTAADGSFSFADLGSGAYSVTPFAAGIAFEPPSARAVLANVDLDDLAFTSRIVPPNEVQLDPIAGSTVQSEDGRATLQVPAGALVADSARVFGTFLAQDAPSIALANSATAYSASAVLELPAAAISANGSYDSAYRFAMAELPDAVDNPGYRLACLRITFDDGVGALHQEDLYGTVQPDGFHLPTATVARIRNQAATQMDLAGASVRFEAVVVDVADYFGRVRNEASALGAAVYEEAGAALYLLRWDPDAQDFVVDESAPPANQGVVVLLHSWPTIVGFGSDADLLAPHRSAWQPLLAYATGGPAGVMDLGGTFTFFTVRYANDQDIFDNATALRRALLARFSGREISILADGAGAILAHAVHQLHYPNHGIGRIIARGGAFHGTPLVQALHAGELAVPAELAFLALQAPGAVHLAWDGFDQNPLLSWTNSDLRSLNNRFPTNLANTYFAFTNSAIADSAALSEVDTRLQAVFGYATDGAVPQPSAHLQRYVAGAYQSRTTELGEATDVEIAAQLVPTVEGMAIVPGGSFQMGDALGDGLALETPVHEVPLSPFYMGESTVTNAEMRDVMQWALGQGKISATNTTVTNKNGTVQQLLDLDGTGSQLFLHNGTFIVVIGKNEHPCVAVTWYGAAAYANFRSEMEGRSPCFDFADWSCDFSKNGYRLPTEAQWEKAARGGLVGQRFPWGDIITHAEANYYSDETYDYDQSPTRGAHPSYGGATAPAAAFAANGYGLRQMAGNVAEWCYDRFSSSWYEKAGAVLLDPTGPDSGSNRVTRGGSADDEARKCRVAERSVFFSPNASFNLLGFRVVRPFE